MKKAILIFCCILVFFSISGCSLDNTDENFQFTTLEVSSADFPDSFDHSQIYEIDVTLIRPNGCTFFEGFEVDSVNTTTRVITAIGTVLTDASCTEAIEEVTATFNFRVDYTETYLFRFYSGNDDAGNAKYLEYEVPVNQ